MFHIDLSNPEKSHKIMKKVKLASIAFNSFFLSNTLFILLLSFWVEATKYDMSSSNTITSIFVCSMLLVLAHVIITVTNKPTSWRKIDSWQHIPQNLCSELLKYKEQLPIISNYINSTFNSGRQITHYEFKFLQEYSEKNNYNNFFSKLYSVPQKNTEVLNKEQYIKSERKRILNDQRNIFLVSALTVCTVYFADLFFNTSLTNFALQFVISTFIFVITVTSMTSILEYSKRSICAPVEYEQLEFIKNLLSENNAEFELYINGVSYHNRTLYRGELQTLKLQHAITMHKKILQQSEVDCKKLQNIQ